VEVARPPGIKTLVFSRIEAIPTWRPSLTEDCCLIRLPPHFIRNSLPRPRSPARSFGFYVHPIPLSLFSGRALEAESAAFSGRFLCARGNLRVPLGTAMWPVPGVIFFFLRRPRDHHNMTTRLHVVLRHAVLGSRKINSDGACKQML